MPVSTLNSNPDLAGKILDLSISTDRSYNKKNVGGVINV